MRDVDTTEERKMIQSIVEHKLITLKPVEAKGNQESEHQDWIGGDPIKDSHIKSE